MMFFFFLLFGFRRREGGGEMGSFIDFGRRGRGVQDCS